MAKFSQKGQREAAQTTGGDLEQAASAASDATLQQTQSVLDRVPGLIASLSSAGAIECANRDLREYLGVAADAQTDWTDRSIVHPDDHQRASTTFRDSLATGDGCTLEYRIRRFDGSYHWFTCRALSVRDRAGRVYRWYVLLTDCEPRKQAEAALHRVEALLAASQRLSSTGTFSWRVPQNEVDWSAQMYRILELDPGSPVTIELLESRVHPEDLSFFRDSLDRARRGGHPFEYELRLRMPDHSLKYLHVVAHGSPAADGLEYLGAVQDVSERRIAGQTLDKARSELAHVNRVMSLGALSASIAHEINQPLSGIVTNASTCLRLLAADPPNLDGARETARRMIQDGNRAAEVTARLRALFSQKGVLAEPVDLNEVAREVIALSLSDLRKNGILFRQELANDLPLVTGDRVQLQQVVLNLVLNACEAMSSLEDRPRQLLVKTEREGGDRVCLTVCDSGVGFEPKNANTLFEAFYTTKSSGMGIGLSVSRAIIESHGGRLWAELNAGPGATFCFSLRCRP